MTRSVGLHDNHRATSERLQHLLRARTSPVAIRFLRARAAVPRGLLRRTKRLTFCQFVSAAAHGGHPFLVTPPTLGCPNARYAFGFESTEVLLAVPWRAVAPMIEGLAIRSRVAPYPGMICMPVPAPAPEKHILDPD